MSEAASFYRRPGRAVALVIVLAAVVLLSALVVAFFHSVTNDRTTTKSYASNFESRQFAETALNIVTAQIKDASAQTAETWASQPGLIRTYGTDGALKTAYKLYSATDMRDTDGSFNPAVDDLPAANWHFSPGQYTDLNAPIYRPDPNGSITLNGERVEPDYPIVDPRAGEDVTGPGTGVQGFALDAAPISAKTPANSAPMPVRWLYILKDGSLSPAAAGTSPGAVTVRDATKENPIVGRVAFWTDDDTCKLNINTAAGDEWNTTQPGSFTDMPRASTAAEKALASFQPVNREYQRYPGHPATTYLTALFPFLKRDQIGVLMPRIQAGGSKGGTVAASTALTPDTDRLFASTDELLYQKNYDTSGRLAGTSVNPALQPVAVRRAGFFMTAHSRAPEINLFNRPRVAIWPAAAIPEEEGLSNLYGMRTTFDKAIAFCSTVGKARFFFVRNNAASPTEDYSRFPRNQELLDYLRRLTSEPAPGFGGDFASKYGAAERDQILTEIFDYIRCTNLADTSISNPAKRYANGPSSPAPITSSPAGTGQVVPIEIPSENSASGTRGFGRFPTVHAPTILIFPYRYTPNNKTLPQNNGKTSQVKAIFLMQSFTVAQGVMRLLPNLTYEVEGLDKLTLDSIPMGFPNKGEVTYSAVSPFHDYGWGGMEGAANLFWPGPKALGAGYPFVSSAITFPAPKNVNPEYAPFNSENNFGSYMTLDCSGDITIRVFNKERDGSSGSLPIQILTFRFPKTTSVPTPRVCTGIGGSVAAATAPLEYVPAEAMGTRAFSTANLSKDIYPDPKDLAKTKSLQENSPVRSVEPVSGDMRLIAGMKHVPAGAFQADADYFKKVLFASSMRCGNQATWGIGKWGRLVAGAGYAYMNPSNFYPAVPSFVNGAYLQGKDGSLAPGDWDTGMGPVVDGPYINKPDEGEAGVNPYFATDGTPVQTSRFSPNRQIPSAVVFGSLSTGVKASEEALANSNPSGMKPWQTLLFCAHPAAKNNHPGWGSGKLPPDHLLLDLFTMPVVEPYPISDRFSTAGKVNLNYQIVPFPYIKRDTALRAVLRSTRIAAIPNADAASYKSGAAAASYRLDIDLDETLRGFDERFANNKPFISASEICTMSLIPKGASQSSISTWWDNHALTGDNLREKPYADIYGRLTTKSNTYTVHVRAESLQPRPGSDPSRWAEGEGLVTGVYRGSYTLERFLNPNMAAYKETEPLVDYKFRVIETKHFAP